MANPCTNMFYATIKENVHLYHTELDQCFTEIEFESKWAFPYQLMEELTKKLQEEYPNEYKDLYMRCLSYDFGCEYVDYMIFENSKWYSKISK